MTLNQMSFVQFQRRFPHDKACQKHLFEQRWSSGFHCPDCGGDRFYYIESRALYQCANQTCRHQASVTAGTIMHRSKVPLHVWFWAMFLVTQDKRGMSALELQRQLGMSYKTAWLLLHKIRQAMAESEKSWVIDGIVEIDTSFFVSATTEKRRGVGTNKVPVIVSLSLPEGDNPAFVKMRVVSNTSRKTIICIANETIKPGTVIITDPRNSYAWLVGNGFHHESKKLNFEGNPEHLNWTHTIISNAKELVFGTFRGLSPKHLQAYLHEFCYRFNSRKRRGERFDHLLNACLMGKHTTYREILGCGG